MNLNVPFQLFLLNLPPKDTEKNMPNKRMSQMSCMIMKNSITYNPQKIPHFSEKFGEEWDRLLIDSFKHWLGVHR